MTVKEAIEAFDNHENINMNDFILDNLDCIFIKYSNVIKNAFEKNDSLGALVMDKEEPNDADRINALVILALKMIKEYDDTFDDGNLFNALFYDNKEVRMVVSSGCYQVVYMFSEDNSISLNFIKNNKLLLATDLDKGMIIVSFKNGKVSTNKSSKDVIKRKNKSFIEKTFTIQKPSLFPEMLYKNVVSTKIMEHNVFHLVHENNQFNIYKNGVLFRENIDLITW